MLILKVFSFYMRWHQYIKSQIEAEVKTNLEKGLSFAEAEKRLKENGPTYFPKNRRKAGGLFFFGNLKAR